MTDPDRTWDDGRLHPEDVIEAADHTAYESPSDYYHGDNGHEPDPAPDHDRSAEDGW
ncbi:hypothetical protein ACIPYS_31730 [Kitasatospora sp. NPDC089913]|uniref:hypothetical protein n=1 Tax=Kitasatospora sp. NPDC089913 TaxID=3364080 RepID=UPI0038303FA0